MVTSPFGTGNLRKGMNNKRQRYRGKNGEDPRGRTSKYGQNVINPTGKCPPSKTNRSGPSSRELRPCKAVKRESPGQGQTAWYPSGGGKGKKRGLRE